ncbi:hypothetical protein L3Y34_006600 [Caenorhabditis briggsae]|uniref:G-protein coupled receptors family 1 profile domain-containing protein n=1 Tax=Caenorhabditis briggsae TaxID=6238 RepID=A0AAE8ZXU3_CAEBR|nr:hypothetical protein L3Y34_006600 [Caenorhabditis briggsae]
MLLSCGVTGIRYSHEKIMNGSYKIPKECVSKFPPNFKARIYLPLIDEEFWKSWGFFGLRTYTMIDGLLKIISCMALPILTFLLIIELEIARRNRRKLSGKDVNTKPDHTTKMITLMTAASIIAECPIGILYVVLSSSDTFQGFYMLAADMSSIWEIFPAINSSTHCLICFIISTQYRKAVEDTFSFLVSTKKDTSVISVSSKSKSGSVANQADKRRKSEY